MAVTFLKRRWHKISAATLLAVIILVSVLAFLVNNYWSPILAKEVKKVVLRSSDSLYTIDFTSAELHVLRGQLIIYNISLKPDTAVYNRRKKQHIAPNNLVTLHVRRLIIYHIHPFSLYFRHRLNINEIILSQPQLEVSYQLNHTKDTVVKDNRIPWQKMSKSLKSLHIGQIFLNDVQLKYSDYSGHKVAIQELKEMNLGASDLLIDSATQTDKSRVLYCRDIEAELNNYTGKSQNGLYAYKINHLKLSTLTSQLNIEGLVLAPVKPGEFFSKTKNDRYSLRLDSVQLNHFDYLNYHKYRMIKTSAIIIKRGYFSLFNNPNKENNKGVDKITGFPTVVLSNLTTDLRIDTFMVHHMNVEYNEFNPKSNKTGILIFDNTSGSILNITNNQAALVKNNISTADLTTYFMGKGKLNVHFSFNLTDKAVSYSYKGMLGQMDLEDINPAVVPFAMIRITSGTVKQFDFNFTANSRSSNGKVTLLYNDLKVKILKHDTTFGLKQKLLETLYANIFIIKHNNPDNPGEAPRTFDVNFTRPISSPFFKTVWNSLFNGIKPSAGLDDKTVHALAVQVDQQNANKQKRLLKKAMRQQRRAARKLKRKQEKGN
jgi:hypothetical protein